MIGSLKRKQKNISMNKNDINSNIDTDNETLSDQIRHCSTHAPKGTRSLQ